MRSRLVFFVIGVSKALELPMTVGLLDASEKRGESTDISKITRKPSKTGKHGHEKRKSTREAKDSKPKPKKHNMSLSRIAKLAIRVNSKEIQRKRLHIQLLANDQGLNFEMEERLVMLEASESQYKYKEMLTQFIYLGLMEGESIVEGLPWTYTSLSIWIS
ncbi:hypothetical protein Tco_0511983 [Tanacetum coccineum]